MLPISEPTATGQLALCPLKIVNGVPLRAFVVFIPEGKQVHEFESLADVAAFSVTRRVQLVRLAEEEGYPVDWQDPSEADWTMLGRMLKFMGSRR
jgi:hypothetical protein